MPSMSRTLRLVVVAALFVSGLLSPALAFQESCSAGGTTLPRSANQVDLTVPKTASPGVLITEDVGITSFYAGQEITTLSLELAPHSPTCGGTAATNIGLALYLQDPATFLYTKVASTNNQPVSAARVQGGTTVTAGVTTPYIVPGSNQYFIGVATTKAVCIYTNGNAIDPAEGFTYNGDSSLPDSFPAQTFTSEFKAELVVCPLSNVVGDPVFTGFHGQQFTVKGEAGSVFNLISSPTLSFNNRFVALASEEESMSAAAQKQVRSQVKQSKLKALVKGLPPATTAWNHPGTYMGESGIMLGESQLYVAPGAYATGFSTVTLDGVALPISSTPVELDGDMTVTRPSAFKLVVSTPEVRFTLVNSDKFINIEHAKVLSADAELTGLLGQTADSAWEVVQSAEFTQHVEADYKVATNKLF